MGCNSHTYIEYRRKEYKKDSWSSLLHHEVDSRNYPLYAKMADVRNYYGEKITPIAPLRGFPEDAGYAAKRDYYLRINDELAAKEYDGYVSSEQASTWVSEGISFFPPDGSNRISHPDWHSASWLTGDEFCSAVRETASDDIYWTAIAAMVDSVNKTDGFECRVVFWFDN